MMVASADAVGCMKMVSHVVINGMAISVNAMAGCIKANMAITNVMANTGDALTLNTLLTNKLFYALIKIIIILAIFPPIGQVIFFNPSAKWLSGDGAMWLKRALTVAAVLVVVAQLIIPSALAYLWPILGFHHSCIGYPLKGAPLPGTPMWPFYPGSGRAELVRPGVAFCPVNGNLAFGMAPPFGLPPGNLPAANVTNKTPSGKGVGANETLK